MKIANLLIVIITGMVLIYGTMDMPDWGDPNSPASRHVSPRYISDAVEKTATP
ncbi:MAG: sodium:proton antiporter, partial [Desulfobacterales bacterium]|nr:sodium:proton antiporter [Desulfobacterales bacterium]